MRGWLGLEGGRPTQREVFTKPFGQLRSASSRCPPGVLLAASQPRRPARLRCRRYRKARSFFKPDCTLSRVHPRKPLDFASLTMGETGMLRHEAGPGSRLEAISARCSGARPCSCPPASWALLSELITSELLKSYVKQCSTRIYISLQRFWLYFGRVTYHPRHCRKPRFASGYESGN